MAGNCPRIDGRPRLSVSMIVRNEALRLPSFFAALGELADEVCITDTGSEDATVDIARAHGCRVNHFPWIGDFAAARNAALRACSGDWVLSLDADECIAAEEHGAIRSLVAGPRNCCYRFITRNYTNELSVSGFVWSGEDEQHAAGFTGWFPSAKVRLFPNHPDAAFEGKVHELIHGSLERQAVVVVDTQVPIHHYPLLNQTDEARARKQALYLQLGQEKIAADPRDARARHELGDQYVDLGELTLALECYKEAVRLEPAHPIWLRDLGSALLLLGQSPQAERALVLSLQLDPDGEEAWRNLGVARARRDDWPAAREAFEQAHGLNPTHPENQRYLAIAMQACGERDGALELLEQLLERFPGHIEARALYEGLRDRR